MRRYSLFALWGLALLAVAGTPACGGDDDSGADGGTDTSADGGGDTDTGTDTGTDVVADDSFTCWEDAALGAGGLTTFFVANDTDGLGITKMQWVDDVEAPAYGMYLESWESFGGPTGPGTYEITAAETNYTDCGLCIRLFEVANGTATKMYMPVEGSGYVTVDSLTIGAEGFGTVFAGSFDLELQELSLTDQETPVAGGCSGGARFAWNEEINPGIPADVGEVLDNAAFTGYADADSSGLIDAAEQMDVEFSFDSIFADTGKRTLIVVMGQET